VGAARPCGFTLLPNGPCQREDLGARCSREQQSRSDTLRWQGTLWAQVLCFRRGKSWLSYTDFMFRSRAQHIGIECDISFRVVPESTWPGVMDKVVKGVNRMLCWDCPTYHASWWLMAKRIALQYNQHMIIEWCYSARCTSTVKCNAFVQPNRETDLTPSIHYLNLTMGCCHRRNANHSARYVKTTQDSRSELSVEGCSIGTHPHKTVLVAEPQHHSAIRIGMQ
jgi:hypothetical protein